MFHVVVSVVVSVVVMVACISFLVSIWLYNICIYNIYILYLLKESITIHQRLCCKACDGSVPHCEAPADYRSEAVGSVPFEWMHAELQPIRDMLVRARDEGKFRPQANLPL